MVFVVGFVFPKMESLHIKSTEFANRFALFDVVGDVEDGLSTTFDDVDDVG